MNELSYYPEFFEGLFTGIKVYMLTAGTYRKVPYFRSDERKEILLKTAREISERYDYEIIAWAILDNHYHLILKVDDNKFLPLFTRKIHGKSSLLLRKAINRNHHEKIWNESKTRLIKNEDTLFKMINHLHSGPVKHKHTDNIENYRFSSHLFYQRNYPFFSENILSRYIPTVHETH